MRHDNYCFVRYSWCIWADKWQGVMVSDNAVSLIHFNQAFENKTNDYTRQVNSYKIKAYRYAIRKQVFFLLGRYLDY